ncbi:MAG: hypothetical protein NTY56_01655 [Patescibacteria group bacterium]|nr:hypothetical protein [Patescibacteria group bacterium]
MLITTFSSALGNNEDYMSPFVTGLAEPYEGDNFAEPPLRGVAFNKFNRRGFGQLTKRIRIRSGGDSTFMLPGMGVQLGDFSPRRNAGRKPRNRK